MIGEIIIYIMLCLLVVSTTTSFFFCIVLLPLHHCYFSAYIYSHLMDKNLGRDFDEVMKYKKFEFLSDEEVIVYDKISNADTMYHFRNTFWTYNATNNELKPCLTDWNMPLYKHAKKYAMSCMKLEK